MNYKKYTFKSSSLAIELRQKGAESWTPSRPIKLWGDSPLIIERDTADTLAARRGMRAELHLVSETQYALEHIALDNKEWLLDITEEGRTIFRGRIERGLYEESYDSTPYEVVLTASDGLRQLDDSPLDIDKLPRNAEGLTPLWEVVKSCLALTPTRDISASGVVATWLASSYTNVDGLRTMEDGLRSTRKAGDILDDILSSLALTVYQEGDNWRIVRLCDIDSSTANALTLETSEYPLYATPSLKVAAAIGAVRLNLPSDTHESEEQLLPPKKPLDRCHHDDFLGTQMPPRGRLSLSSEQLIEGATLPSASEQEKGIQLLLPYILGDALAVAYPYNPPPEARGLTFVVEVGFDDNLTSEENDEAAIELLAEVKIGTITTPQLIAAETDTCYLASGTNPICQVLPAAAGEQRTYTSYIPYLQGGPREGRTAFLSPWSVGDEAAHFAESVERHLPTAEAKRYSLREGRLARFSFSCDLPYPQTLEIHNARLREGEKPLYEIDLTTLAIYIPLRFSIAETKEIKNKQKKIKTPFHPSRIKIGRISLRYDCTDTIQYEQYLYCDRKNSYQREAEEVQLAYTTAMQGIRLPNNLKGLLLDESGQPLRQISGRTSAEWVVASLFSLRGKPTDTLTLTTRTRRAFAPGQLFRLRNRPGHTYRIAGSRYDVRQQEYELILTDIPTPIEETRYDL